MHQHEDPEEFFNELDRRLELVKQRHNAFIAEVETEVNNQAFLFFVEYAIEKETITKRLQTELHENILMLSDTIEDLLLNENQNEPTNPTEFTIPPKHKFKTAEQELEHQLNTSTPPHTPEFIQEMTECINEERTKREFQFAIYNQIMKTTFNHFRALNS